METPKATTLIQQFNATIEKWIRCLDDYTLEMLHQKPQPGSWSVGQIYVHITDDTRYFVEQMRAALSDRDNSEKEMHRDAKAIFENNGFPDALVTGPATDASVSQPQSKEELLQRLISIKEDVNQLYISSGIEGSGGKSRHPGLLYFSAPEWLQFAEMHMRHHFRQKKRIDDRLFSHLRG